MKDTNFIKCIREAILHEIKDLSIEQLNTIPEGFNNNIIWNAAHLIASDQRMFYLRTGQAAIVSTDFIAKYQKGTRPDESINESEIKEIKKMLLYSIEKLSLDLEEDLFKNYEQWTTSYGNTISSIDVLLYFYPSMKDCIWAVSRQLKNS